MKRLLKKNIDELLLSNGFKYYNDWEYGPVDGWIESHDHVTIKLMEHDFGYWIIFEKHASGINLSMNIGEACDAKDIIELRDALKKCKSKTFKERDKLS